MAFTVATRVFMILLGCIFLSVTIWTYNAIVTLRHQVDRSWANIDVILRQRFDEIPQLIKIIEQFSHYEKNIITQIVEARRNYGYARKISEKVHASNTLSSAFFDIMAFGEAYPDLKASRSFQQLQNRISDLETQLADRRETFNEAAILFNTRLSQFPDLFFAGLIGYKKIALFSSRNDAHEKI